jgi:hyperosmotically inducible protein
VKVFLALVLGIVLGAAGLWFYSTSQGRSRVRATANQVQSAAKATGEAIQEKLRVLDLRPQDIKEDLARTGQVVRRKAREAGKAIADATADARITAAIKAKLVADKNLSALSISVNTTGGIVTLSGAVASPEDISRAMLLAMDTDGVQEVISTLQVKPRS